ncbi:MAG: leucyl/phenylalanyl-tRNA--protein transferase [Turneriella sp.]|nr:leucyl/phenylalanyl-tRNA--protein transferase [Leptospiraceae bacterium]MCX7631987.1 leucyl/phenylalanyl-tRNA--protein transferase [Turneriella sp.]
MQLDIHKLTCRYEFPPTSQLRHRLCLAVGGDLKPDTLLYAYSRGIFPWYDEPPIRWCSPPLRTVLAAGELHLSRSLLRFLRKTPFHTTRNAAFAQVIGECARSRKDTWITPEMEEAYIALHELGFAESCECWFGEQLVGGVYGVVLNRYASLESTFHYMDNAGKVAIVAFYEALCQEGVILFDFQVPSALSHAFGAREVPRHEFEMMLKQALS